MYEDAVAICMPGSAVRFKYSGNGQRSRRVTFTFRLSQHACLAGLARLWQREHAQAIEHYLCTQFPQGGHAVVHFHA